MSRPLRMNAAMTGLTPPILIVPGSAARAAAQLPRVVNTGDPGDDEVRYERSAASALRLITSVLLGLAVLGLEGLLPQASLGLENDLQHHAGTWAGKLGELANAIATTWSVTLVVVTIVIGVVARRPRAVFSSCLAAMLAAGLVVVVSSTSGLTPDIVTSQEWQLAVIAAAMAMAATSFTLFAMPIARWSVAVITLFTLLGVLSGDVSIASRLVVVLVGQAVGSIVALALGVPSRRIGRRELAEALDRSRLVVDDLDELDGTDARGSVPWVATSATGRRVFVKVQAVDELRAAQLFRIWQALRLKDPADTATPRSIRQHSEHEAFVAQCARAAGALTPAILAIGDIGEGRGIFTAFETIDGETLTEVGDLSDAALRAAWSQIQILHRAGIAHHDLRASNLMSVGDEVWVIDFGAAEVDASSEALERDVAEFLASTASLVGPERAVDSAVAVLGADAVAECIPWLQPLAATAATRRVPLEGRLRGPPRTREGGRGDKCPGAPPAPAHHLEGHRCLRRVRRRRVDTAPPAHQRDRLVGRLRGATPAGPPSPSWPVRSPTSARPCRWPGPCTRACRSGPRSWPSSPRRSPIA